MPSLFLSIKRVYGKRVSLRLMIVTWPSLDALNITLYSRYFFQLRLTSGGQTIYFMSLKKAKTHYFRQPLVVNLLSSLSSDRRIGAATESSKRPYLILRYAIAVWDSRTLLLPGKREREREKTRGAQEGIGKSRWDMTIPSVRVPRSLVCSPGSPTQDYRRKSPESFFSLLFFLDVYDIYTTHVSSQDLLLAIILFFFGWRTCRLTSSNLFSLIFVKIRSAGLRVWLITF